jgi:tRNA modification GTPase
MNGLIDLTEAEGIGDLIAAETDLQRRQALRVMSGAVSNQAESWRAKLLEARALVELTIDWADEEVPEDVSDDVRAILDGLAQEFQVELARSSKAERLRSGFEIALVGAPNVGKSSLLNAIVGRDAAITSDIPGTTRDVIEVRYDLNGVPLTFLDLAGLRETSDPVERIGVERARRRAESADVRLFLVAPDVDHAAIEIARQDHDLIVATKSDLVEVGTGVAVSARQGEGLDDLLSMLGDRLPSSLSEVGVLSHHRHSVAVAECLALVQKCRDRIGDSDLEVVAEDLRRATAQLESVIGRVGVEDVLGTVFLSFCLGK